METLARSCSRKSDGSIKSSTVLHHFKLLLSFIPSLFVLLSTSRPPLLFPTLRLPFDSPFCSLVFSLLVPSPSFPTSVLHQRRHPPPWKRPHHRRRLCPGNRPWPALLTPDPITAAQPSHIPQSSALRSLLADYKGRRVNDATRLCLAEEEEEEEEAWRGKTGRREKERGETFIKQSV